jgi:parvulin-like peptidyl-prolyl isomerase
VNKTLGAVVLSLTLALAGCGDGELRTGAAAVVGDTRISDAQLATLVDAAKANPEAAKGIAQDEAGYTRQELSRLVNREILAITAREEGVSIGEGAVDARLAEFAEQSGGREELDRQAAENGLAGTALRDFVRDLVLSDALGDKLVAGSGPDTAALRAAYDRDAAKYNQVRASHILVADKGLADSLLAQVKADPSKMADLARQFSTDTGSKEKGGDLGFASQGQFVPEFDAAVFGGKPGDVVQVQTQFGFHVIKVEERRTTTFEQAEPELRESAVAERRDAALADRLRRTAEGLKISVNPRYGRYDVQASEIVPVDSAVSSPTGAPAGEPGPAEPAPEPAPAESPRP